MQVSKDGIESIKTANPLADVVAERGVSLKRLFADHSGSFAALRDSGGRNAAMILSRRYSSSR